MKNDYETQALAVNTVALGHQNSELGEALREAEITLSKLALNDDEDWKLIVNTNWVYLNSEPGLWTTGFYDPAGKWHSDEDYPNKQMAADRVRYLNGGDIKRD